MPKIQDFVSNDEWKEFQPNHFFPLGEGKKMVTEVTHVEVMQYAAWLSQKTGRKLRLVTEQELIEAEKTFKADFSNHPLKEVPDVGTFGANADGVTDLLGVGFTWCANEEDLNWARSQWSKVAAPTPASAPTPVAAPTQPILVSDPFSAIRVRLTTEAKEVRARLAKLEGALEALQVLEDICEQE
jgi:hypothetical protein